MTNNIVARFVLHDVFVIVCNNVECQVAAKTSLVTKT
jgi:hypothetical protein